MTMQSLNDLFVHTLSDVYSAEVQLTKALPKMAEAATETQLVEGFKQHLEETKGHIERLDQVIQSLDNVEMESVTCVAMEGLIKEGEEIIQEVEEGPVRDAGLIVAAQKVEHYEISSYGSLMALAKNLGYDNVISILQNTLDEEKATDEKLTMLAEQQVNQHAA
ncbi:ferritin-like domain-containing protein [Erwinia sp. PK3-005]|uniref:Ferritin-like domain-containing protein n=1 Tax=Mixta hanseatica TaxID=2872648 RepID=A0ABY4RAJ9_9GAMM|nr:ferritin-like domain-containing protein [Mixta hanseatica]UQY45456.1 ferritin-like domain-containing protein [Mixta hanseatica]